MPETLSKILKQNYPYKKYLPAATAVKYAKCLITALKDIHVTLLLGRQLTYVIGILSPRTYLLVKLRPSYATLGLLRS